MLGKINDAEFIRLLKDSNNNYGALSYSKASKIINRGSLAAIMKKPDPREKFNLGTLVHELLLTPEVVENKYMVENYKGKSRNEHIASLGKIRVSKDAFDTATQMVRCIRNHKTASQWLSGTTTEITSTHTCSTYNIDIKCKLDAYRDWGTGCSIVDLKTIGTYQLQGDLRRYIVDSNYHMQAAAYLESVKANTGKTASYVLIFVETDYHVVNGAEHHGIRCCRISNGLLQEGVDLWDKAKSIYADACNTGIFTDYPDELIEL
jgi:hypothetical protein